MKRWLPVFILVFGVLIYYLWPFVRTFEDTLSPLPTKKLTKEQRVLSEEKKVLFVPYWTVGTRIDDSHVDELLYFGISPDNHGINTADPGYKNLRIFLATTDATKKRLLVVRMLDATINAKVLDDKKLQNEIILDTVALARENGFDGVVLDYELAALSFPGVIQGVTDFVTNFSTQVKKDDLSFGMTIYGDTYYRFRPYNVKELGIHVDEMYVMAYDFHKARGNPGPNFPLQGKETYGYDFTTMVENFSSDVSKNKLTFIFGMFGYDWMVDEKEVSIDLASPLSTAAMQKKFIERCLLADCHVQRDQLSGEMVVRYKQNATQHIVWFEDHSSVDRKQQFLEEKGLQSVGYWAYSYY